MACRRATNRDGSDQRFDVLRAATACGAGDGLCGCFSAHPLEADAAELYGAARRLSRRQGRFRKERAVPRTSQSSRSKSAPRTVSIRFHTWRAGRRSSLGRRMRRRRAPRREGTARLLSRRLAQFRGDRPAVGRRRRRGQPDLVVRRSRFLSRAAARRLHQRPAGVAAHRPSARATSRRRPAARISSPTSRIIIGESPPRPALARSPIRCRRSWRAGNTTARSAPKEVPQIEETAYWFNLLIDTTVPICGNAAQRPHGQISNDGPKNIADSVEYIASRVWADRQGRNRAGVMVLQEQQFFAAREVAKVDARPGGYVATGGHGGILGGMGYHGARRAALCPGTEAYLFVGREPDQDSVDGVGRPRRG